MEYRTFDDTIVIRLDPGDEICACMLDIAAKEKIHTAEISGLGALDHLTVALYDVSTKAFHKNAFEGAWEVVSLTGTLTRKDGEPYLHAHISAGDETGRVVGGHLLEARVSATAEILIRKLKGEVGRKYDEALGLNLFSF